MLKSSARSVIRLRGVRHNNLKNFDLDLPLNQLIVITGLSGSGKSSLAFDTLFAEGQRRYIETFSPYARQFFDRMDKPQVDSIEGIPPAIAIEQRNSVRTTRSTVGTMTEICDYMKMLWPHVAQLHCRQCLKPVRKDSPQMVWEAVQKEYSVFSVQCSDVLITFDLPLTEKLSLADSLALIAKQGYQRLLAGGQIIRVEEASSPNTQYAIRNTLTVIQDRLKPISSNRARFVEACEQAYHFGKGKLAIHRFDPNHQPSITDHQFFSNRLHCADCDIEYREPSPALFSFNHPVGACPACKGFGRIISIDYNLAMPDRSRTIKQGVVKPWLVGHGLESQSDLLRACRELEIPVDVPFEKLPKKWQKFVIEGDPEYGTDEDHQWPRCWYGVKGYFRWLESKAYKMHVRVLLSRYRAYTTCPTCNGQRFQPDSLLYLIHDTLKGGHQTQSGISRSPRNLNLADFYQLPIRDAVAAIESLGDKYKFKKSDPIGLVLHEVHSRLNYLMQVGLGYLTLDRPTRSLSGGETERVSLTTCLGTCLVNTLFVLDEPSVGLHPRDTERLVSILERLRDAGNTVIVVEHEASVMRAADQIVDLGPGHGAAGGSIVFQGRYSDILRSKHSLTGQYLSGRRQIELPERRPVDFQDTIAPRLPSSVPWENENIQERRPASRLELNEASVPYRTSLDSPISAELVLSHASKNNLKDISVEFPLGRFVCVTGVSGSGKTTLIREVLLPLIATRLGDANSSSKASDRMDSDQNGDDSEKNRENGESSLGTLEGAEHLSDVVLVDQSILGKTPRSNPAVYIGAFDDIREVFAQSELAKQRGLNASAFSFNSAQGQCERCRGAGFEKIEMQFLSDVFIRCPDCDGRRYRSHILEVKIRPDTSAGHKKSIGDLLDSTVEEAIEFLSGFSGSRPAQRAVEALNFLAEVGLGYLKLGQPINTLSGGESQRLKLVRHLAESSSLSRVPHRASGAEPLAAHTRPALFLFDEPTTGLHFDDVRVLLKVFQRLVEAGHSIIVIEHNLDVIKSADWVIDLGPDAGDQGGQIVAEGTPEQIAEHVSSHTGAALRAVLPRTNHLSRRHRLVETPR